MKRSTINSVIRGAEEFLSDRGFPLPPFAFWNLVEWRSAASSAFEIVERRLGWDVTDFASGDFDNTGLCLFTLRNGSLQDMERGYGETYAEKVMVSEESQVTPLHFHWCKTEDIINRGGGDLAVKINASTHDEELSTERAVVSIDGARREVPPGEVIELRPGQSVTIPARTYHAFWATGERTIIGEVSSVNDDTSDNRFHQRWGRFPAIEEDEAPRRLLVGDYDRLL